MFGSQEKESKILVDGEKVQAYLKTQDDVCGFKYVPVTKTTVFAQQWPRVLLK